MILAFAQIFVTRFTGGGNIIEGRPMYSAGVRRLERYIDRTSEDKNAMSHVLESGAASFPREHKFSAKRITTAESRIFCLNGRVDTSSLRTVDHRSFRF